eukprot:847220_1
MIISYLLRKEVLDPSVVSNLNWKQKEEMQRGIVCVDNDYFDPLIDIVNSCIPDDADSDEDIEIEVDDIDDTSQIKLYNFMLLALRKQEVKREEQQIVNAPVPVQYICFKCKCVGKHWIFECNLCAINDVKQESEKDIVKRSIEDEGGD